MKRTNKQIVADDIDRQLFALMGRAEQAKLGDKVQAAFWTLRLKVRQLMH